MKILKKTCAFFGIVFAWILSIILVGAMVVAPLALEALSVADPAKVADVFTDTVVSEQIIPTTGDAQLDAVVQEVVASDAMKEVAELYMTDLYNALGDENYEALLTKDVLQRIVEENMDELITIVQNNDLVPDYSEDEIRNEIHNIVENEADTILEELPSAQQITTEVVAESEELQIILKIISQADTIKTAIVVTITVLAILIFVCRWPGFRGFRWLATDLYISGGLLVGQCAAVIFCTDLVFQQFSLEAQMEDLIRLVLNDVGNGLMIRTAVVFAAAILMSIVYSKIKRARAKKATAESSAVDGSGLLKEDCAQSPVAEC